MGEQRGVLRALGGDNDLLGFWCPGCAKMHIINTDASERPAWGFNGNYDKPTFTPSVLTWGKRNITDEEADRIMAGEKLEIPDFRCHSFVTDGMIQFLDDCTHALRGQTVPLEPFTV